MILACGTRSGKDSSGRSTQSLPCEVSGSLLPPVRRALRSFPKAACNVRRSPRDDSQGLL
jgi:hypothetical protein